MSDLFDFNGARAQAGPSQTNEKGCNKHCTPSLRRSNLPRWPRASEPELVRHYTLLSQRNFGIDTGF